MTAVAAARPHRVSRLAALCSGLLVAALLGAPGSPFRPASAAVDPAVKSDTRFTAEPLPTWQTNGVVYAIEAVGDVVYVGGNFSHVRPPEGEPGGPVARKNMAAFDARTGDLLPFSHTFSAPDYPVPSGGAYDKTCQPGTAPDTYTCDTVYEIRASSDGTRLYVGGDFQRVDGQTRGNLAAFALPSGSLTSFAVDRIYGRVRALAVSDTKVYFGGHVNKVSGQDRQHLAAVSRSTGALTGWHPRTDGPVIALALNADRTRVMVGGDFDNVNGVRHRGVMAVSPTTGANTRWVSNPLPGRAGEPRSFVTDFAVSGNTVYVSAEGLTTFDGRVALNALDGSVRWKNTCRGATWAIEKVGTLIYTGSHAHNCTYVPGGFEETSNNLTDPADAHWHRFQAEAAGDGAPALRHWFPTTNGGIVGELGPRDLAWSRSADVLWAGGEFTTVNGEPQQGLTRFGRATSPDTLSATPEKPSAPLVVSDTPGQVRVSWEATADMDNATLTYTLTRNGSQVTTRTAGSDHDSRRPTMTFVDSVPAGQTATYRVVARDASGRVSATSSSASVVVAGASAPYRAVLRADEPVLHWPLDDQADRVAGGLVIGGGGGRYTSAGVAHGVPGAVASGQPGDAVTFDGELGMARARHEVTAPSRFTTEIWFRGTGSGKLSGFGSSSSQTSTTADRHLYVDTAGRLVFGVIDRDGVRRTLTAPTTVDDNQWHHAVAGVGGTGGMRLFLDGTRVGRIGFVTSARSYSGYWQLGGDSLSGWPNAPTDSHYGGSLDEFAVYHRELTSAEVAEHFDKATP